MDGKTPWAITPPGNNGPMNPFGGYKFGPCTGNKAVTGFIIGLCMGPWLTDGIG